MTRLELPGAGVVMPASSLSRKLPLYLTGAQAVAVVKRIFTFPGICAIDFETSVAPPLQRIPYVLSVAHEHGHIAVCRLDKPGIMLPEMFAGLAGRAPWDDEVSLTCHNAIFEAEVLAKYGVHVDIECSLLAAKCLYLTAVRDGLPQPVEFSLAALVEREFGRVRDKSIRGRDWSREDALDEEGAAYCRQDAVDAAALWKTYRKRLLAEGLMPGYNVMQMAIRPTAALNLTGMHFDIVAHRALCHTLKSALVDLDLKLDTACARAVGNHSSTTQVGSWIVETVLGLGKLTSPIKPKGLRENPSVLPEHERALLDAAWQHDVTAHEETMSVLHARGWDDKLRLLQAFDARLRVATGAGWRWTATGKLRIDKGAMARQPALLRARWPRLAEYLEIRAERTRLGKLLEAFGPSLSARIDEDGRVRGQFKPFAAWTGRQSCVDPNLQNQPRDPEFRALWVAPLGRKLVIADYGQIELRILAVESGDEVLRQIYRDGRDIHAEIAMAAFDLRPWELTKEARTRAKAVSFGIAYGSGASGLAEHGGFSLEEARELLERVLTTYPGLRSFREDAPARAAKNGWIDIRPHRRVRYNQASSNATQAINAPIQGGAASVQMIAMRLIYDELTARPDLDAQLCASVHDEFLVEAPDDDRAEAVRRLLVDCMGKGLLAVFPESADMQLHRLTEAVAVDAWSGKP